MSGGEESGWHAAITREDPELRRQADALEAEFGGAVTISARFGFFRADWANLPPGVVASHFEADTAGELREKLALAARRVTTGTDR